eukprot:TRINITY_DN45764_c0_g1_i1.p2 TRINITY_DN45764_c0_g1~~TRINITY_DN45764_c0_g1_i1.p2  ORF type:complete len:125 (+),score=30.06 TRINITY_DN45764_c0_g1_i1:90-464(+)
MQSKLVFYMFRFVIDFFFFKQKTAYEMQRGLVGSEMCIRDRYQRRVHGPESDRVIEYVTAKRGISQELPSSEASLYSLFSVITPKLLESLSCSVIDSFEVISDSEALEDNPPAKTSNLLFFSKN